MNILLFLIVLWFIALYIVQIHEMYCMTIRRKQYVEWLNFKITHFEYLSESEREEVINYMLMSLLGQNKELHGPWEKHNRLR